MSLTSTAFSGAARRDLPGTLWPYAIAAGALAAGGAWAWHDGGWRILALWITGAALGAVLYRSAFGFTFGFRALLREGRGAQVRGQLLLLGLLVVAGLPLIEAGAVFGQPVRGFVFPIGLELVIGAFLFGIGMQIAGGCASGTLYAVGGGSARMLLTLAFMVAGATLAAATVTWWDGLPSLAPVSVQGLVGTPGAILLHVAAFAALWLGLTALERRRTGRVISIWRTEPGQWSYGFGAVALAALCLVTLVLAGRPWAITQGFTLWGSWGVEALRLDEPAFWPFWEEPTRADALHRRLFTDVMSVMNIGLMVGAAAAAVVAGRFALKWRMTVGEAAGSIIGGLLLGFGAIMAMGCNISAYVSGIASGSLHGWVWLLAALPGTALGLALRPLFGLDRPR